MDPYLDPNTGLLRNLLGISDPEELAQAEAYFTRLRIAELELQPIRGAFDLRHLQAFHRHIAGDLVDWAGKLRTVDISKSNTFCRVQNLEPYAQEVFAKLAEHRHLRERNQGDFVVGLASFYADINALHPFREFNGRTQRAFMSQLARQAGWAIAWHRLDAQRNVVASIASFSGNEAPFRELLEEIVEPVVGLSRAPTQRTIDPPYRGLRRR